MEQVGTDLGVYTPEVSHLPLLGVMDIELVQKTGGYTMSGLYTSHFAYLYDRNYSETFISTQYWDGLLKGVSTPSMRKTAEFF